VVCRDCLAKKVNPGVQLHLVKRACQEILVELVRLEFRDSVALLVPRATRVHRVSLETASQAREDHLVTRVEMGFSGKLDYQALRALTEDQEHRASKEIGVWLVYQDSQAKMDPLDPWVVKVNLDQGDYLD